MPLDASIYSRSDYQLPERLANILDPTNIQERKMKLSDLASERKTKDLQLQTMQREAERAPIITARQDAEYAQKQAQAKQAAILGHVSKANQMALAGGATDESLNQAAKYLVQNGIPQEMALKGYESVRGMPIPERQKSLAMQLMTPEKLAERTIPEIPKADNDMAGYLYDKQNNGFKGSFQSWLQGKSSSGSPSMKPRGLSREAGLKWELERGLIDTPTYDMAMRGTAGGKELGKDKIRIEDQKKSADWLNKKYIEIENTMADSLGIPPDTLNQALTTGKGGSEAKLESAVGFIESNFPALTQDKRNILSHIDRLKNLGQTGGLAELRKAGIAPGTITEKEWPKFQADLANIDESLSGKELLKQYIRIYQKIQDSRTAVDDELSTYVQPAAGGVKFLGFE